MELTNVRNRSKQIRKVFRTSKMSQNGSMLKVQLLMLPIVAPEKKTDPIFIGLKVADSILVIGVVGRVVVSVRGEMLASWLLLERLSARDIRR